MTKTVSCQNLEQVSWDEILASIPQSATHLLIENADFSSFSAPSVTSTRLEVLRISHSNISHISPLMFLPLPQLRELHLVEKQISDIMSLSTVLYDLPDLQILNLSNNSIDDLPEYILWNGRKLKTIDLSGNRIAHLPTKVFQYLPYLQHLSLANNKLAYIHPLVFANLSSLVSLQLHSNKLQSLHNDTFRDMAGLREVALQNNLWDCSCELRWLHSMITSNASATTFLHKNEIVCETPFDIRLSSVPLLSSNALFCEPPVLVQPLKGKQYIQRLATVTLYCNATGYPDPSVYWMTPHGVTAHTRHRTYMTPEIIEFHKKHSFKGIPTYFESHVIPQEDGSLAIHQMRHYFSGQYSCIAENPGGIAVTSFNVSVTSPIRSIVLYSIVLGGITSGGFLLFGIIIGAIRWTAERFCCNTGKPKGPPEGSSIEEDKYEFEEYDPWYIFEFRPRWLGSPGSPGISPMKCTTPAEAIDAETQRDEDTHHIRHTLESVRARLWGGVGRRVDSIRNRAAHIRESSSYYMSTIRESGSSYVQNIRSSSSQYATRMRAGMAMGVESVKYHVQSMKELCGTGDIGHTVSAVSMATDVEAETSQKSKDVVQTITFV